MLRLLRQIPQYFQWLFCTLGKSARHEAQHDGDCSHSRPMQQMAQTEIEMHGELWAGVRMKLDHAAFHLEQMSRSIQPSRNAAALEAAGANVDIGWQRSFYAHFDAFLSAARSVPEILECCFGHDQSSRMSAWFDALPADEQRRRNEFRGRFAPNLRAFRALDLGTARHISEHRRGFAQVDVTISDIFGVVHVGGSIERLPSATARQIDDPNLGFLARPMSLRPHWGDFTINGKPLFTECQEYLKAAQALIDQACNVVDAIHGTGNLSHPA